MNDIDFIVECARIINEQNGFKDEIDEVEHRMAGPAAALKGGKDEIAEIRQMLNTGVVEFEYWKINKETNQHELRHAVGTTSDKVVPITDRIKAQPTYMDDVAKYEQRSGFIVWYWDLDKNQTRCFNTNRFDNIVKYEPTTQKASAGVSKIGDIFIHKDVDAGFEQAPTEQTLTTVNQTLTQQFQSGGAIFNALQENPEIATAAVLTPADAKLEPDGAGGAKLIMIIKKNATDEDPAYQLPINAIRQAIKDEYGVTVKRVEVDGLFQYT